MISPKNLYEFLLDTFGHQHWWPVDEQYHQNQNSDPRFEIIVGAILTQNTAWTNVEKALDNLKKHRVLTVQTMANIAVEKLKTMIQPSGFFNQKAERLKLIAAYIEKKYHKDLLNFFSRETSEIRHELLSLKGIGPETADSILLYAGNHPVFVIDSYTKRFCQRFPLSILNESYDDIQHFFENELKSTIPKKELVSTYKEFHALLVELVKNYCWKKNPSCATCPLTHLCEKLF
jgi:endonuclease-3 related protein